MSKEKEERPPLKAASLKAASSLYLWPPSAQTAPRDSPSAPSRSPKGAPTGKGAPTIFNEGFCPKATHNGSLAGVGGEREERSLRHAVVRAVHWPGWRTAAVCRVRCCGHVERHGAALLFLLPALDLHLPTKCALRHRSPMAALLAAAVGALAVLGLIALAAHVRHSVLLEKQGKLKAFLPEAERQMRLLRQEMPGGRVAKSFPREERELGDLYARTEKGLEQIDQKVMNKDGKAPEADAKALPKESQKARTVALSQGSRVASKQDLAALVNKAGSTMYVLEHQLPMADRKMFPKEARELQAAFGSELSKLSKVYTCLTPSPYQTHSPPENSVISSLLSFVPP